ncbi:hypothetical protein GW931_02500 [archaeon]|nr:hypothetical protein [archaeon]
MNNKSLWEILVPKFSNEKKEFEIKHHQKWDKQIRKISGGLTILRTAKGQWININEKLFAEETIPVRIYCCEEDIDKIMNYTLNYYDQEAIFAYQVNDNVKILEK